MADAEIVEYRAKLNELLPMLRRQHKVDSLALFGSYVRGDQRPDSDLDILVTFSETPDLFSFLRLAIVLEDALGIPVDLVMKDSLKPHLGKRILEEATPI